MYHKKRIYYNDPHATNRFIKWNIPKNDVRKMLKYGVIIDDYSNPKIERKLCICKWGGEFKTIVFQCFKDSVFIITGYPSKEGEKREFKKMKRRKK